MDNRILVIADQLFGENGEAASRFSELLLCKEPERPLQFVLNVPLAYPLAQLPAKIAFDIIGKQAKRIVLGVGQRELSRGTEPKEIFEILETLVKELLLKTTSYIYLVTIPPEALPEVASSVVLLNSMVQKLAGERVRIADFAAAAETFMEQQAKRGKFARTLYSESGKTTSICQTLLALFMQDAFLEDISKQEKR